MNSITLLNGRQLSQMAYGVWCLSEATDTRVNANLARIDACLAQGITTFDHADIYGDYRCEALFGEAIKARPALHQQIDIMLMSQQWPTTRVKHYDTKPAYVTASMDRSLQRHRAGRLLGRPDRQRKGAWSGRIQLHALGRGFAAVAHEAPLSNQPD